MTTPRTDNTREALLPIDTLKLALEALESATLYCCGAAITYPKVRAAQNSLTTLIAQLENDQRPPLPAQVSDAYALLASAVKTVVEQGVQKTSGPYSSAKNNKCVHDRFGFEGCEDCVVDYLADVLKQAAALSSPSQTGED